MTVRLKPAARIIDVKFMLFFLMVGNDQGSALREIMKPSHHRLCKIRQRARNLDTAKFTLPLQSGETCRNCIGSA
jgi:hypothetical protein